MIKAGRILFRLWPLLLFLLGIACGAGIARLLLASKTSTISFLANRVEWFEQPILSQTISARRIANLVIDTRLNMMETEENADHPPPMEAVLILYTPDGIPEKEGPTRAIRIRRKADLVRICEGIEMATRPAFPSGMAFGTYNVGELILQFSDGTSVVFWLSSGGFSTISEAVEPDFIFFSPRLSQALRDVVAREGELPKYAKELFDLHPSE